jgi:hypothetical protein
MTNDTSVLEYFFEAVEQAATSRNESFCLAHVMNVPWAWQIVDGSVSRFGWVVQLWDGRRVYLEYRVDEAGHRARLFLVAAARTPTNANAVFGGGSCVAGANERGS